jgi:hypothetical protein
MRILPSLFMIFLLSVASLRAEDQPSRNPLLEKLGDNAWHYMDPKPSQRWVLQERNERSPVKEITSKEPAFREYTSPAYGDGKIFYFGGGHSGYFGNDMEVYDPLANVWRQMYRPHCPPPDDSTYYSGGSERSYVDPKTGAKEPYVLHGYARTGFDKGLGLYVSTTVFPETAAQDPETGQWKLLSQTFGLAGFDVKANRWQLLAAMPDALKSGETSLSYDPQLGGMLGFSSGGVFLFKDRKWTRLGDANVPMSASGGAAATYLPQQKSHLIAVLGHGGKDEEGALVIYDVARKAGRRIDSMPEELRQRIGRGTGAFNLIHAYDAANDKVIVMSANSDLRPEVWTFDVAANHWEKLPASDSAPKLHSVFEPGVGRAPMVYDPVHEVFFLLIRKESQIQTWAYRYRATK